MRETMRAWVPIPWVPRVMCATCERVVSGKLGEMGAMFFGRQVTMHGFVFACRCGFRAMLPTTPEGVVQVDLSDLI